MGWNTDWVVESFISEENSNERTKRNTKNLMQLDEPSIAIFNKTENGFYFFRLFNIRFNWVDGLTHIHIRIENLFVKPIKIIEIQTGKILKETDIVRYKDIYGRVN